MESAAPAPVEVSDADAPPPPRTVSDAAAPPPPRTVRVLCLHGHSLSGEIFEVALLPLKRTFPHVAPSHVKLELICPNGLHEFSVEELEARVKREPEFARAMASEDHRGSRPA